MFSLSRQKSITYERVSVVSSFQHNIKLKRIPKYMIRKFACFVCHSFINPRCCLLLKSHIDYKWNSHKENSLEYQYFFPNRSVVTK